MNKADPIILAVWTGISILVCFLSLNLGIGTFSAPGPGLFPFVFGIFLGSASILYYFISFRRSYRPSQKEAPDEGIYWRRPGWVILSLVLYCLVLVPVGFLVSTSFLLFILFNAGPGAKREWKLPLVGALTAVAISYLTFYKLLQIPLPRGILGF